MSVPTKRAAEERALRELWAASDRLYEQSQRRHNARLWTQHHKRLREVFQGHADHHEREQERYQRLLDEEPEEACPP